MERNGCGDRSLTKSEAIQHPFPLKEHLPQWPWTRFYHRFNMPNDRPCSSILICEMESRRSH